MARDARSSSSDRSLGGFCGWAGAAVGAAAAVLVASLLAAGGFAGLATTGLVEYGASLLPPVLPESGRNVAVIASTPVAGVAPASVVASVSGGFVVAALSAALAAAVSAAACRVALYLAISAKVSDNVW